MTQVQVPLQESPKPQPISPRHSPPFHPTPPHSTPLHPILQHSIPPAAAAILPYPTLHYATLPYPTVRYLPDLKRRLPVHLSRIFLYYQAFVLAGESSWRKPSIRTAKLVGNWGVESAR
ncbi:hypothetical protein HZH68_007229 [Vespula germanica]|uniref:Uncharacterized protein n=1 Tax=Vespula germanica TaxID=30212 RepID=A0A834K6J2_VESGE|nr:hypothetical protein HZH68_007229 [Vespula germanica]